MNKSLITVLLISSLLLVGCGDNTTNNTTNNTPNQSIAEIVVVDTKVSSADEALQMLKEGNERFVTDTSILMSFISLYFPS